MAEGFAVSVNGEPAGSTAGNARISMGGPAEHAACDAEIARLRAKLLHFGAEAHRRKWLYQERSPEAFDALHRLGDELIAAARGREASRDR